MYNCISIPGSYDMSLTIGPQALKGSETIHPGILYKPTKTFIPNVLNTNTYLPFNLN